MTGILDPYNGAADFVELRLGEAYQTVKTVADALPTLTPLAENIQTALTAVELVQTTAQEMQQAVQEDRDAVTLLRADTQADKNAAEAAAQAANDDAAAITTLAGTITATGDEVLEARDQAVAAEANTANHETNTNNAALAAQAASRRYDTTAAGITGTTDGQYFFVPDGLGNLTEYKNVTGTATATGFILAGEQSVRAAKLLALRNDGYGTVIGGGNGNVVIQVPANRNQAFSVFAEAADGSLGSTFISFNSKTGKTAISKLTVGALDTMPRISTLAMEIQALDGPVAADQAMVFDLPSSRRMAWGTAALFVDGKAKAIRAPWIREANYQKSASELVHRGGRISLQNMTREVHYGIPSGAGIQILQGASLRPKGKRSHQQCPSMAKTEHFMYVAYSGTSKILGGDFSQAEGADSYIVISRRPLNGDESDWVEIAQCVSNTPIGRISDVMLQEIDGRVAVFLPYSAQNGVTNYTQAIYLSFIENPDAPVGSRMVFSDPVFLTYGFAGTGFKIGPDFFFTAYIPMNGYPTGGWWGSSPSFAQVGHKFVTPGARLCRLGVSGVDGLPFIEDLTMFPREADASKETFTEPQIVKLNRHLGAAYDFWLTTRSTEGPREAWGTRQSDGSIVWTPLSPCLKFNGNTASVRRRVIRTQMGNLAYVGNLNPAPNRFEMGIAFSQNEATSFPTKLVVESASSVPETRYNVSYPDAVCWIDPASGRSKIAICYDEGRGVAPGYPANIWFHEFFEDEILAGTVTTAASMAARELVDSLEYTG